MQTALTVASVIALWAVVFMLVGAPMLLTEWRKRRKSVLARQIALADAPDAQLGATVTPRVKKLPWGPWEIQIAVPLSAFAAVGKVLAIVDQAFSGVEGVSERSYRVVLRLEPVPLR